MDATYHSFTDKQTAAEHGKFLPAPPMTCSLCPTCSRLTTSQSLRQFLSLALKFCNSLEAHHNIEETYLFPILGTKMEAFDKKSKKHGEMLAQHRQIHKGLEDFQKYLGDVRDGEKDFVSSEMLALMEAFEKVLWQHLDEEVVQLGAENMRKYWTTAELSQFPI